MRIFIFGFVVFSLTFFSCNSYQKNPSPAHQFTLGDADFLLDGKPFQMISGEMHYTRIPPEYWRHRMQMAKAMGINTIGTYVFWNAHEPEKGKYDFSGNNDIAGFLQAAKDEGLWVVLRPSPYVCAEWEFGGYPWWLLKDSSIKVRSKDERFIAAYNSYIKELAKHLVPHLVTHGGNVLMVQLENEYGSYGNDKAYLEMNSRLFREAGFDGLLFTCDGADKMADGHLPGYLPAVNGLEDTSEVKKLINKYHNGKGPYYVAEWYPGWFDQWGKQHAMVAADKNAAKLDNLLAAGISVNMYMFHGGTTRDFMNGANMNVNEPYAPQVSSYDYDAPLDEAGNPTEKYFAFRDVIGRHLPPGDSLPAVPTARKAVKMNDIRLTASSSLFDHLPRPVDTNVPLTFEDINQAYGYVLYRTVLTAPADQLKINGLRDYAIIYMDGKKTGTLDRRLLQDALALKDVTTGAVLDIFVESNGRINYGPYLTDNRKGITGSVLIDGKEKFGWKLFGLPFSNADDFPFADPGAKKVNQHPTLYKGTFVLDETADTYLDMRPFGKGFVMLNGHNLGKYWSIGPQQTLYVPACWLKKGNNEVIVFDALKQGHTRLTSLANGILNEPAVAGK